MTPDGSVGTLHGTILFYIMMTGITYAGRLKAHVIPAQMLLSRWRMRGERVCWCSDTCKPGHLLERSIHRAPRELPWAALHSSPLLTKPCLFMHQTLHNMSPEPDE